MIFKSDMVLMKSLIKFCLFFILEIFFLGEKERIHKMILVFLKNKHGRSTRKNQGGGKRNKAGLIKMYEIIVKFYGIDVEIYSEIIEIRHEAIWHSSM